MNSNEQGMRSLQLDQVELRASKFMTDVYVRMMLALLGAAGVGYLSISSGLLLTGLQSLGRGFSFAIFGTQLLTVIMLQGSIFKLKSSTAQLLFAFYAAVTGLTLGMVGLIYTLDSIITIGFASAGGFAALVTYGKVTKRDLGPIGTFCITAIGMLMFFSLAIWGLSMFYPNASFIGPSIKVQGLFGALIFSGLTAYEAQRLKKVALELAENNAASDELMERYVNSGALSMFMNYIGLFLSLMRLFGSRR